ncbi:UbiH/UbiF/VisC/COQ6 family ubiquinone biosynthesis hydroxylase [Ectothiorhodospira lacustris]|uniref:UbiH/UbiF/VisC/COQ6 family ubiquinone biosynthesis hydroxylase n=1 Tax=Ectothiorhodospira lacustris TaxID=2899127 RepID=UPI001EE9250E|nr:UbiH/UbiF/VisC/COQ6 family ubiquinone biosynthesis hydroxylase [Ectothiorhodospira lacustris]MCG5508886.1 UbiH/UbiF/VisC/COQ6 family ubiquinone biosynthesis hydroxylase [Ectothiorhodospira lacustris]MCG5520677.1 UbiH/UbiF/VisC/COQ6 family ubiquinone biosynthesis hydroxylase [Ectothiorhodospira lacustris]
MSATSCDVLIAGGGMVGAALALSLARGGLAVALVELHPPAVFAAPDGEHDLRVSAINRASQRLFQALGVWEGMRAMRVSPYQAMEVWDAGGNGHIRFEARELGEPDLGHIIENRVVQRALWDALEAEPGVTRFCPDAVTHLDISAREARVTLESGVRITASLVVGADGARSRIREMARIGLDSRRYDQQALVATVRTALPHRETARQRFLPTGPLAFLPLADGRCSVVWSADDERAEQLRDLDDAAFREALAEGLDHRLGAVLESGQRAAFPLRGSQARHYVRPRLALVGDAAHTIHPLAGQGVNLGFQDARTLVEVLLHGGTGDPGELRLLRRYERARRGDNVVMMRAMELFRYGFGSALPPLALGRNLGLTLADRAGPIKKTLARRALGLDSPRPPCRPG